MEVDDDDPSAGTCTFALSGEELVSQRVYECRTCGLTGENGLGMCYGCASTCHAEHDVDFLGFGRAFCDCGHGGCALAARAVGAGGSTRVRPTDEEGRVLGASSIGLDFGFRAWDLATLSRAAPAALTALAEQAALVADAPDAPATFWLDGTTPVRTALERLVSSILALHARTPAAAAACGAEWWCQAMAAEGAVRPAGAGAEAGGAARAEADEGGLSFHYDKDEQLAESGVGVWPAVSTVTYLRCPAGGGAMPTVVLSNRANDEVGQPMREAHVSFPEPGKHIQFDGRLLHGVPPASCAPLTRALDVAPSPAAAQLAAGGGARVTLLVNIWAGHVPTAVRPLPEALASALRALEAASGVGVSALPTELGAEPVAVPSVPGGGDAAAAGAEARLRFHGTGLGLRMWVPGAVRALPTCSVAYDVAGVAAGGGGAEGATDGPAPPRLFELAADGRPEADGDADGMAG